MQVDICVGTAILKTEKKLVNYTVTEYVDLKNGRE
jgi:hypothetical protein